MFFEDFTEGEKFDFLSISHMGFEAVGDPTQPGKTNMKYIYLFIYIFFS